MFMILLVGLAGAAGAMSRYGVGVWAEKALGSHFAYGTLLVNALGCLALGFLLELERGTNLISPPVRILVAVGYLGAFTTFSTFGYETLRFFQAGTPHLAWLNIAGNLGLGLLGVWLGLMGARSVAAGW
jgi:CrcB protein